MVCCWPGADPVRDAPQGANNEELKRGPLAQDKRGCTDCWCLFVLAAAWVLFFVVTFAGFQDGNPSKLYRPRDYQGAYCGVAEQWNNGPNLDGKDKRTYMMNVSSTTDVVAKQLLCSTASRDYLTGALNQTELDIYLCACCFSPCGSCRGSQDFGGDLTSGDLAGTIAARMADLTNPENVANLFTPGGANGDVFGNMWSEATKYFVSVCLSDCSTDYLSIDNTTGDFREYTYAPSSDNPLKGSWERLMESGPAPIRSTIADAFTFRAFPESVCPYLAANCVPFPGVQFSELSNGYCTFQMAGDVVNAVGGAAASAFAGLGGESLSGSVTEEFGRLVGDFENSLDSFVLVAVSCFAIGLIFMIALRFCVGVCVWTAIFLVLLCFAFGGGLSYVRSIQCKNDGFLETGQRTAVAVVIAGRSQAVSAANGVQAPSEAMTGDGADYRGTQTRTASGKTCQAWDKVTPHSHTYTTANHPNASLTGNYCRNPYLAGDRTKASTIWCFTTDTEQRWEECSPIGLVAPACPGGHAVDGKKMRDALQYCAYFIWLLGALWVLLVFCLRSRIRLAIALNKVAATFIAHTPRILLIPAVQAIVGILWCALWALSASFLLSQVPDSYTPKGYYETYAEAFGVDGEGMFGQGTPGACTDKWPTGFVWKDEQCDDSDPPKCWRCAPPRYILDQRFAFSFFIYLWNNAFLIAIGQCIIAGAVASWFFTPNARKGKEPAIKTAVWNVFRFHAGSLALGSFIIAVVQFIRYLMKYLEKQAAAQKNRVMVMVFRVLQCCIWCFEKCLKFLSKNAYIQIAIRGTNFCNSARKAFTIITANILRFGTVALLGSVVHYIGLLFIMASTTVSGYFILKAMHGDIQPVVPLCIYAAVAYVVGKLFMNVFGLAVDTCLQCIIFAEENNPGEDVIPGELLSVMQPSKTDG